MKFCFYLHVMSAIFTSEASIQAKPRGPKACGLDCPPYLTRSHGVSGRGLQGRIRPGPLRSLGGLSTVPEGSSWICAV